jgi:hypothetical protein
MATLYGEVGGRVEFFLKNPTKLVTYLMPRSRYGDFKFFSPKKRNRKNLENHEILILKKILKNNSPNFKKFPKKNTAADNLKDYSNSKKNAHYIFNFLKLGGS